MVQTGLPAAPETAADLAEPSRGRERESDRATDLPQADDGDTSRPRPVLRSLGRRGQVGSQAGRGVEVDRAQRASARIAHGEQHAHHARQGAGRLDLPRTEQRHVGPS